MLAKLFWRRFRCAECHRLFDLPLDDTTLPPHSRHPAGNDGCHGIDAVPA